MSVGEDFVRTADAFRPELLAHCYRMVGSVHDAEDLVQETYLRAWRSYDRFEGRASLRTWLYRIATNTCLTALERGSHRPLPAGIGAPSTDPAQRLAPEQPEVPWLQPIPDRLISADAADPAAIAVSRDSVRLAFVAALQHLSARQRAVLILRDVLAWPASEVAELLDTSVQSVNSALQRARARLAQITDFNSAEPSDVESRSLLRRYVEAMQNADMTGLARLLREDVEMEMPPIPTWFVGRDAVAGFLVNRVLVKENRWRYLPARANSQPAFAAYLQDADGVFLAHGIQVLTIDGDHIARIVAFLDPSLMSPFGLPTSLKG